MISNYKVLAVIPARGGSKRIPKKNIKPLCGKPLINWSIECALASSYIDRTIVSTDSQEIADISKEAGAEVPFLRPAEISVDSAVDFDAFLHVLTRLKEDEGYVPDIVVQLRPTSPLRTAEETDAAIKELSLHPEVDSLRSVTEPDQSPYKMYSISPDNTLAPLLPLPNQQESFNLPQASLPKAYKHVGYLDVIWTKTIMEKKQMTGTKILPFIMPGAVSGINKPEDWDYYEFLMKKKLVGK